VVLVALVVLVVLVVLAVLAVLVVLLLRWGRIRRTCLRGWGRGRLDADSERAVVALALG
jgi:hypothetical protein